MRCLSRGDGSDYILDTTSSIIVVHNHPSGDPTPSREDVSITRDLVSAGKLRAHRMADNEAGGSVLALEPAAA